MSERPLISIKAGRCLPSRENPKQIIPSPEPGRLYLYSDPEDELLHFCWKPLNSPTPVDDLVIVPGNATWVRYPLSSGRIYILKFSGSHARHFYWLQSKPENPNEPGQFSARDEEAERTISRLLAGYEDGDDDMMEDEDETMEDVERRPDGASSREGGADGGRAPTSATSRNVTFANPPTSSGTTAPAPLTAEQSYLHSLLSSIPVPPASSTGPSTSSPTRTRLPPLTLPTLLPPSTTIPLLPTLSTNQLNHLLSLLPPTIHPPQTATDDQKRAIIAKVLRSPQFVQSLAGLTGALRDEGGLRGVCESLGIELDVVARELGRNGSDGVGGYVEGVRDMVEREERGAQGHGERMEE